MFRQSGHFVNTPASTKRRLKSDERRAFLQAANAFNADSGLAITLGQCGPSAANQAQALSKAVSHD
jgi:hypothetical protein